MQIDRDWFVDGILAITESVYSFHDRFEIDCVDTSDFNNTAEVMKQRLLLLSEEIGEHARAINRGDARDAILEAVDVAYIVLGTLLRLGPVGVQACYEVARKNDAKNLTTHAKHPDTGKILEA